MYDDCDVVITYRPDGKCLEVYSVVDEVMSIARSRELNEEIASRIAEAVRKFVRPTRSLLDFVRR